MPTKDKLGLITRKLGPNYEMVVRRLNAGESKKKVAASVGLNARWLTDLKPVLNIDVGGTKGLDGDQPAPSTDEPEPGPISAKQSDRDTMASVRRLASHEMPIADRIKKLAKLARSGNESVAMKAIELLNSLTGVIASKTAIEPDPPPLFALPEHSMLTLEKFEEWVKTQEPETALARGTTETPSDVRDGRKVLGHH